MSQSLFPDPDEAKRQRLHARGFRQRGGTLRGVPLWADPSNGSLIEEPQALAMLERLEAMESEGPKFPNTEV